MKTVMLVFALLVAVATEPGDVIVTPTETYQDTGSAVVGEETTVRTQNKDTFDGDYKETMEILKSEDEH